MRKNICIDMDAYKAGHPLAIHQGLTEIETYAEARLGAEFPSTCFVGLDVTVKENFLTVPTLIDLEEAREEQFSTFGYDMFRMKHEGTGLSSEDVWKKVMKLGYIPVDIKAVPEGLIVPQGNVLFTTKSTQDWFAKHSQGLETTLMHWWYPSYVSTRIKYIKEDIKPLVEKTGTIEKLDFMINDFGARGATSYESAAIGGMAVLLHSQGSDNMIASRLIKDFYGYQGRAKSVWATEHTVALSFNKDFEVQYLAHQLDSAPLNAIVANVIDTYDSRNYMHHVVGHPEIKARIIKRAEAGGSTVFRPDSGIPSEQVDMCLDALTAHFGYSLNSKGYKILNHNVFVLQGDGMTRETILPLYQYIVKNNWSTDNLLIGSGGGLLQVDANRDKLRAAIKPSTGIINGQRVHFEKNPASDPTKKSKSGSLKLINHYDGSFTTISTANMDYANFNSNPDVMKYILKDGEFCSQNKWEEMVERASRPLRKNELL